MLTVPTSAEARAAVPSVARAGGDEYAAEGSVLSSLHRNTTRRDATRPPAHHGAVRQWSRGGKVEGRPSRAHHTSDATVQTAALKIQKVFRGAMERKRLNLNLRMIKRRVRSRFDSAVTKLGTLRKGVALMNHSVPMRGNGGKVEELSTSTVVATQSPPPPASSTAAAAANVAPSSVTPNNNPRERNSTTSFEEQMCGMQNLLRDLKRDIFEVKNKLEYMENGFTRVS